MNLKLFCSLCCALTFLLFPAQGEKLSCDSALVWGLPGTPLTHAQYEYNMYYNGRGEVSKTTFDCKKRYTLNMVNSYKDGTTWLELIDRKIRRSMYITNIESLAALYDYSNSLQKKEGELYIVVGFINDPAKKDKSLGLWDNNIHYIPLEIGWQKKGNELIIKDRITSSSEGLRPKDYSEELTDAYHIRMIKQLLLEYIELEKANNER